MRPGLYRQLIRRYPHGMAKDFPPFDSGELRALLDALGLEGLKRIWLGDPSVALLAMIVVSGPRIIHHPGFPFPPETIRAPRLNIT